MRTGKLARVYTKIVRWRVRNVRGGLHLDHEIPQRVLRQESLTLIDELNRLYTEALGDTLRPRH